MNKKLFVKTRFAPSPTGMLHVGGARTALFNYLFAKKFRDGKFIFRIEDTDLKRSSDFYAEKQYEDLRWLQLNSDQSPFESDSNDYQYKQSQREEIYKNYLKILLSKKKAYFCFCNESEIKKERDQYFLKNGRKNYKYSRKCFYLQESEISRKISNGLLFSIRFFVNNEKSYTFEDGVRGTVKFLGEDIEDFIIFRKNKTPLLNFAVVVDDHQMEVSHVIRAEEHLTNTAKQVALYECFGWKIPRFFHISIIVNNQKKKISKRDEMSQYFVISNLRNLGYLPEAINNYLFFLGFNPVLKGSEILSFDQMVKVFDEKRFNSRPSVFSIEKLNWFNSQWIRKMSDENFSQKARLFLSEYSKELNLIDVAKIFKEQISCFSELSSLVKIFFSKEDFKVEINQETKKLISELYQRTCSFDDYWSKDLIENSIKEITKLIEKDRKKVFFVSIRKILTGIERGPEISTLIHLMGKNNVKKKFSKFITNDQHY